MPCVINKNLEINLIVPIQYTKTIADRFICDVHNKLSEIFISGSSGYHLVALH